VEGEAKITMKTEKLAVKKCLILSDGPVPAPEHTKVEGGGLRCWGLAKGILANEKNIEVTVAYNESYKKDEFTSSFEGVSITTWSDSKLVGLLKDFDSIIVSYCMGNLSVAVAEAVSPAQQLVLDCYVPIYVEMSARKSVNIEEEYEAFNFELDRWASVLRRGDVFLCANDAQKSFYEGVLGAVGRINPVTYGEDLIHVVPYGIYREEATAKSKPIQKLLKNKKALKVLWFGGIYPWFDLTNLIEAVGNVAKDTPCELTIVGAKNPFNTHPDFIAKYESLIDFIETNNYGDVVHVVDWINFNDRADWYLDSDIVVVVNQEGPENKLAWRTRLVDFVWADLPILTNGGDPLGEMLIANNAAARLKGLDAKDIELSIKELANSPDEVANYKKSIKKIRGGLYWDVSTKSLANAIESHSKPKDSSLRSDMVLVSQISGGRLLRLKTKARKIPNYYRKHGLQATMLTINTKLSEKFKSASGADLKRDPKIIVVSHQLDLSGAPYVLLDIVKEMVKDKELKDRIDFRTFTPIAKQNIAALNAMGVKPKVYLDKNIGFSYVPGDVVVLNTFAQSSVLIDSVLGALEKGTIKHVYWYAHEAAPDLFINSFEARRIQRLLIKQKLTIYATAQDCMEKYIDYFNTEQNIVRMPYRFDIPLEDFRVLDEDQFNKLSFILPGTVGDGRKGQMPVLYAFIDFYANYYKKNPKQYRDFTLKFVGLEKDFLSQQVILNGKGSLGDHFEYYPKVSRERNLELTKASNVTLCYSLQEALPLFVYEGMAFGHPIIRNQSSGLVEQLVEGKNGYRVESDDFEGLVAAIEKMLNKETTTSAKLADMSAFSNKLARKAKDNQYIIIDDIQNQQ
jgi:glycosyltransferase involved in cell wall biosynthesis